MSWWDGIDRDTREHIPGIIASIVAVFGVVLLAFFFGKAPGPVPENPCNYCLYNSCSSGYVLLGCGQIQNDALDAYFAVLREEGETYKSPLYAHLYGKSMGDCFTQSRAYCRAVHCREECESESDGTMPTIAIGQDTIVLTNTNLDSLVTVRQTDQHSFKDMKIANRIVAMDACYANEIDVQEMYTSCINAPIGDDCTSKYSVAASRRCKD
jgi:hypothetical protein